MTEILFVLTTIYVAYVAYSVFNGAQANEAAQYQYVDEKPSVAGQQEAVAVEKVGLEPAQAPQQTDIVIEKPAVAKVKPAIAPTVAKSSVRDPKTGEVSSVAANYRFTKRWIKEALVSEGLLNKVYKNNELDAEAEALIKGAMAKLEAMEKYRV